MNNQLFPVMSTLLFVLVMQIVNVVAFSIGGGNGTNESSYRAKALPAAVKESTIKSNSKDFSIEQIGFCSPYRRRSFLERTSSVFLGAVAVIPTSGASASDGRWEYAKDKTKDGMCQCFCSVNFI